MVFSPSRKFDFPQEPSIGDTNLLIEKKEATIPVGNIQSNLRWDFKVQKVVGKASKQCGL